MKIKVYYVVVLIFFLLSSCVELTKTDCHEALRSLQDATVSNCPIEDEPEGSETETPEPSEPETTPVPEPEPETPPIEEPKIENKEPTAVIESSVLSGIAPLSVEFSANKSSDSDGSIESFLWDFGDDESSEKAVITHTFQRAGSYSVNLKVTDNQGASSSSSLTIDVIEATPEVTVVQPTSLSFILDTDSSDMQSFSFSNSGNAPLDFTVSTDAPWLTLRPETGTTAPNEAQSIQVIVTCASTALTDSAIINLEANDPNRPTQNVTVNRTCESPIPPVEPPTEPPTETDDTFEISLNFSGSSFTDSRQAVFNSAAARWAEVITADIPDVNDIVFRGGAQLTANLACGYTDTTIITDVDDIIIFASIRPIDGAGGILGQAGPSAIRSNALPFAGCMEFDSADVTNLENVGSFENVILHEMGHVLGIGTLWERAGLVDFEGGSSCSNTSSFSSPPVFTGELAEAEYATLGKSGSVPIEDEFGAGTKCGHWDEAMFDNELMTGFAERGAMPLSRVTAASLQDLGYSVDLSAADAYSLPSCSPNCTRLLAPNAFELWETTLKPKFILKDGGEVVTLD